MKTYTGTKTIQARPMTRGDYNVYRGWTMPVDENGGDEGYLVEYLDGGKRNHDLHANYISWSPKVVFERTYKEVHETTYQERVITERDELKTKFEALIAFLGTQVYNDLVQEDRHLLALQCDKQGELLDVLEARINRFQPQGTT